MLSGVETRKCYEGGKAEPVGPQDPRKPQGEPALPVEIVDPVTGQVVLVDLGPVDLGEPAGRRKFAKMHAEVCLRVGADVEWDRALLDLLGAPASFEPAPPRRPLGSLAAKAYAMAVASEAPTRAWEARERSKRPLPFGRQIVDGVRQRRTPARKL